MNTDPPIPTAGSSWWRQRLPTLAVLLVAGVVFAVLFLPTTHDDRPEPGPIIDGIINHADRRAILASSARMARGSMSQGVQVPGTQDERGMTVIADDHRTLIVYWSSAPDGSLLAHSVQLLDSTARTAKWLMLDQERMKEYLDAAARTALPAGPPDP